MVRRTALAFLLVLLAGPLRAETLDARLKRLADVAVKEDHAIGIVVGVGLDGQPPAIAAAGLATLDGRRPMTRDTLWKAASIGKTFYAALALSLAEEGKLSLDDTLARFAPDVPNAQRVSLRQLLDHTSGYGDYITDAFTDAARAAAGRTWSARELLAYATPEHLDFAPGSRYDYSNTNYLLLGMALTAAAGEPPAAAIRRRFLIPLGLSHTWFAAAEAIPTSQLAHGYADLDDNGSMNDATNEPWPLGGSEGELVSNASDLVTWAEALYGGRVLPPKRLAEMLAFVAPSDEESAPGSGYGLGVERARVAGVTFYGHTGSAPGYSSVMLYEPSTRAAIVIALNEDPNDEALLDILAERVIHALEDGGHVHFPHKAEAEPALSPPAP